MSGRATKYVTPCQIEMTLLLESAKNVDTRCKSIGPLRKDDGTPAKEALACARRFPPLIVVTEDPESVWHEVQHLLDRYCLKK